MKQHGTHSLLCSRPVFWLVAFLALGSLRASPDPVWVFSDDPDVAAFRIGNTAGTSTTNVWKKYVVQLKYVSVTPSSTTRVRYKVEITAVQTTYTGGAVSLGNTPAVSISNGADTVVGTKDGTVDLLGNTMYSTIYPQYGGVNQTNAPDMPDWTARALDKVYAKTFRNDSLARVRVQVWDGLSSDTGRLKILDVYLEPYTEKTYMLKSNLGRALSILYTYLEVRLSSDGTQLIPDPEENIAFNEYVTPENMETNTGQVPGSVQAGSTSSATGQLGIGASGVQEVIPASGSTSTSGVTGKEMAVNTAAIITAIGIGTAVTAGAIKGVEEAIQSGGSGAGTDVTGVESRLDTTNELLGRLPDNSGAAAAASSASGAAASDGSGHASTAAGTLPGAPSALGYSAEVTGGSSSFLAVEFPPEFGGKIINFNPFGNESMAAVATWFRGATQWAALLLLGGFVFGQLRGSLDTIATARQASGNPVVGGTGAQGTAAVNAGLITAAALVALTALAGWAFDSINIAGLVGNLTTSPLVGMGADAYWFLDQVIPCSTLITCAVARAAWHLYAGPVLITYITVCRFFVA